MKSRSPLRSSVRRILALALPARRPRPRSLVLLAAFAALSWGSGVGAAPGPLFRQEKIPGLSSFDVEEVAIPEFGDLDGDGDLDLVAGDYLGKLRYFENCGNAVAPLFREGVGAANPFRNITDSGFARADLADLDQDGDLDLLLGEMNGALRYFRNTGTTAAPAFLELTGGASPFSGLAVVGLSAPELGDLDGDGDLDAAVGEAGGRIFYFLNTGGPAAPAFAAASNGPFAGIDVGSDSAPQLADLDGDGDLDLAAGNFDGKILYFSNAGTASAPAFVALTGSANPFAAVPDPPGNSYAYPALVDLYGSGRRDLGLGEWSGSFRLFRNTGSASAPAFAPAGESPLAGPDLDDFGSVAVADLDADGDLDAVTGEYTHLRCYRNSGGPRQPAFRELKGAENPIVGGAGDTLSPALGDLDFDGDLDLLAADYDGVLHYFANTGSASAPAFVPLPDSANPFAGLLVGSGINHPALGDLDGDGDLDLVVSHVTAKYFENTGSPAAPAFVARTGSANPFDGLNFTWGGSPDLVDYDFDGDLDLVAGALGEFRYFGNTGSAFAPAFAELHETANPFAGLDIGNLSVPAVADLDGDGDLDLLAGDSGGWLVYFADGGSDVFRDGFESGDAREWSQTIP